MSEIKSKENLDRRVQRTRKLLNESIIELIIEKGYESITVQDIIDRANLGRSTFYAHYRDKEDLLLSGMDDVVHRLIRDVEKLTEEDDKFKKSTKLLTALPIFRHAKEHFELYKAMVAGKGIELVTTSIQDHLSHHIEEQIKRRSSKDSGLSVPPTVIADYLAGSLLSMLTWWLDNEMPYSPEEMDKMFRELTGPGVKNVLTKV